MMTLIRRIVAKARNHVIKSRWVHQYNLYHILMQDDPKTYKILDGEYDYSLGKPGDEIWELQEGYLSYDAERGCMKWYKIAGIRWWHGRSPEVEGKPITRQEFRSIQKRHIAYFGR